MAFISEEEIVKLLDWHELVPVIERSLLEVSSGTSSSAHRLFMDIPEKPASFLLMPCFSSVQNIITCKLVTIFPKNTERNDKPTIAAVICVFDADNGSHICTMGATAITEWRTAAASIVATKYLHCSDKDQYKNKTLAVLGAGKQGIIHIIGLQTYLNFGKIKLWNRTYHKAEMISEKLLEENGISIKVSKTACECVRDADVVVVAFSATREDILLLQDVKQGAFVCVAGTSDFYPSGIERELYHNAALYTGCAKQTKHELNNFIEKENLEFQELGTVISGKVKQIIKGQKVILFQSLGLSVMDNASAKYILQKR